jgi:hypothetical protein
MSINLKKSSLQRIYEFGLRHIRKQGCLALQNSTCVYRTNDGCKCIVGGMLTDEQLALHGIGNAESVSQHREKFAPIVGRNVRKLDLLVAMQQAQDRADSDDGLASFEARIRDVAEAFNLKYAPPGVTLRT